MKQHLKKSWSPRCRFSGMLYWVSRPIIILLANKPCKTLGIRLRKESQMTLDWLLKTTKCVCAKLWPPVTKLLHPPARCDGPPRHATRGESSPAPAAGTDPPCWLGHGWNLAQHFSDEILLSTCTKPVITARQLHSRALNMAEASVSVELVKDSQNKEKCPKTGRSFPKCCTVKSQTLEAWDTDRAVDPRFFLCFESFYWTLSQPFPFLLRLLGLQVNGVK